MNEICKQGYHFVGNKQFSGGFLGSRRSKMFTTGFIEVCLVYKGLIIINVFSTLHQEELGGGAAGGGGEGSARGEDRRGYGHAQKGVQQS